MGNSCSCLNNITSLCSEDLSHAGNDGKNFINNDPKCNLSNYAISERYDPMISQRNTTEMNTISSNSNKKNTSKNKKNNKNKNSSSPTKKNNNKNNNNKNNNKYNNTIKINNNINNSKISDNKKFEEFCNSPKGQEMSNQMEKNPSYKLCLTLHKYFLKILKKKSFLKNIKKYRQEGEKLFNLCEQKIYNSNEILSRAEKSCKIKYAKDSYRQFYPNITPNEEEKMKYIPKEVKTLDNSIIINYQNKINQNDDDNNSNNIDNILWIYKGQTNLENKPNGYGVKYVNNGIKQEGYWKEGQLYGWSESIDFQGNILIGPFIDDGKITGKGIKYSFMNNTFYKGDMVKSKKEGKGEEISNEGIFCGNFIDDKKNGEGKMVYSLSGDIYEGNYKDDLFDGKGHYIWKTSGQEYTGEYKNGLMHGKGLYEWSEGEYYRGNFVNGKKEGNGEMHWANGRSFIGPFVNGRPQGVGIFDNGINYKGEMEFIDGKLNKDYLSRKYRGSESSLQNSIEQIDNYL